MNVWNVGVAALYLNCLYNSCSQWTSWLCYQEEKTISSRQNCSRRAYKCKNCRGVKTGLVNNYITERYARKFSKILLVQCFPNSHTDFKFHENYNIKHGYCCIVLPFWFQSNKIKRNIKQKWPLANEKFEFCFIAVIEDLE